MNGGGYKWNNDGPPIHTRIARHVASNMPMIAKNNIGLSAIYFLSHSGFNMGKLRKRFVIHNYRYRALLVVVIVICWIELLTVSSSSSL